MLIDFQQLSESTKPASISTGPVCAMLSLTTFTANNLQEPSTPKKKSSASVAPVSLLYV